MTRDEALAEKMNLLPEVEWDRWGGWYDYPREEDEEQLSAASPFGWIARDDGRFDFFVLTVFWAEGQGLYHLSTTTSSALYSRELSERLGIETEDHRDCRRIEDDLGDLVERKVNLA